MIDTFLFLPPPFWCHYDVTESHALKLIRSYLGPSTVFIDITEALNYLRNILEQVQNDIQATIHNADYITVIEQIYNIFDTTFRNYIIEKKERKKIDSWHIRDEDIIKSYALNRNAYLTLLSAANVWIENYLLLHKISSERTCKKTNGDINADLFVMLYVYGIVSHSKSLLTTSQKFNDASKFPYPIVTYKGLVVNEDICNPIELIQYHPIIYFDPLVCGNQGIQQNSIDKLEFADISDFGDGFKKEHGLGFMFFIKILNTIIRCDLDEGRKIFCSLSKQSFMEKIQSYKKYGEIDPELFYRSFVLDKNAVTSQLKPNEKLIWKAGVNKYRHEIRPFICLDDNQIFLCYSALEQAKQLWLSIYSNGGNIYSNVSSKSDALLQGIELNTKKRTIELVSILRNSLRDHYSPKYDEIDVSYDRIFGKKKEDYGDYDIVFYTEKPEKELFLIEAKYFSDSLNAGAQMTDYEKLFRKGKYYDHCRKRYDLVLSNPEAIKNFVKAEGRIKVHFLFVSSKPLEIEFTDPDGIVSFPCLSIFDKYLEGKIESEDGSRIIRPFHII